MKIGILGGTFNPIHCAHLILAEMIRDKMALDRIVFVPACRPPHKVTDSILEFPHRLRMVQLAIQSNRYFACDDIESRLQGPSFTINTLTALSKSRPADELFMIIGSDTLCQLQTWKACDELSAFARFIVIRRNGYEPVEAEERFRKNATVVDTPLIEISSSEIRRCVAEGKSIAWMVPDAVREYIQTNKLYR